MNVPAPVEGSVGLLVVGAQRASDGMMKATATAADHDLACMTKDVEDLKYD